MEKKSPKTSIVDIGTKSIKHYIFDGRKQIHFGRESSIRLGENILKTNKLDEGGIVRAMNYMKKVAEINKEHSVEKTIVLGTDAFRKAENKDDFISKLKQETGYGIRIISHEEEAELLGKACKGMLEDNFAIANLGGGSTEVVVFKDKKIYNITIPFGGNKIRQEFLQESYDNEDFHNKEAWKNADEFLRTNMKKIFASYPDLKINHFFLTGVLNFAMGQKNLMDIEYKKSEVSEHPIQFEIEKYKKFNNRLKDIGVKKLAENYPQDPNYAENFTIGQEIYIAIADELDVKTAYPDEIQYVHGLLE